MAAGISSDRSFFDEAGTHLSKLTFTVIYGREPDESRNDDLIFKESDYNIRKGFAHTTSEVRSDIRPSRALD
ncbi:hypothetical protein V500_01511 [Pseudogymnoascus sp. VKM F-4518 (FW-2643)]|nr:hypothetical protein V500_01511 [Pseudogymnoascus sp. VKM F-4518 (FW-2643)]